MKTKGEKLDLAFTVTAVEGGQSKEVVFADLLGEKNLVSLYMKNNTPSCDRQNRSLGEATGSLKEQGVRIISVSPDGAKSHLNYADKHNLGQILVSDKEKRFAAAADAIVEKKMVGKTYEGPARAAFLINREGVILDVIEKVDPANHAGEVMALLNR